MAIVGSKIQCSKVQACSVSCRGVLCFSGSCFACSVVHVLYTCVLLVAACLHVLRESKLHVARAAHVACCLFRVALRVESGLSPSCCALYVLYIAVLCSAACWCASLKSRAACVAGCLCCVSRVLHMLRVVYIARVACCLHCVSCVLHVLRVVCIARRSCCVLPTLCVTRGVSPVVNALRMLHRDT